MFLYTSRVEMQGPREDKGIEVCVCPEENCMEASMEEERLLEFAIPKG